MFKPTTLLAIFGLARLQEEEVIRRSHGHNIRNYPTLQNTNQIPILPAPPPILRLPPPPNKATQNYQNNFTRFPNTNKNPAIPIRRISSTQIQERREKGLCYYCDEKFQLSHRCNKPRLFLLEGMGIEEVGEEEENEGSLAIVQTEDGKEGEKEKWELLGISLHAIGGHGLLEL